MERWNRRFLYAQMIRVALLNRYGSISLQTTLVQIVTIQRLFCELATLERKEKRKQKTVHKKITAGFPSLRQTSHMISLAPAASCAVLLYVLCKVLFYILSFITFLFLFSSPKCFLDRSRCFLVKLRRSSEGLFFWALWFVFFFFFRLFIYFGLTDRCFCQEMFASRGYEQLTPQSQIAAKAKLNETKRN